MSQGNHSFMAADPQPGSHRTLRIKPRKAGYFYVRLPFQPPNRKECVNNELDEHAHLDVEINNLRATDEELEKLKHLIVTGLGKNATPLKITAVSNDAKGSTYKVTFRILNPRHFNLSTLKDWLHAATLVGWSLNATFVRP